MKYRLLILSLILIGVGGIANAQNVFKAIPKPSWYQPKLSVRADVLTVSTDSTMNAWRFIGPMGGYLYTASGQQVVTGLGFGFQHLRFIDSTGKWTCQYSINAIALAGGNAPPTLSPFTVMSVGISLGLINNLLQIGPVYNLGGSFGVFATLSVSLNN